MARKMLIILLCLSQAFLLSACRNRAVETAIDGVKSYLPEVKSFVEENKESLEILISIQSEHLEYRYMISEDSISVFDANEDWSKQISETSLDRSEYLTEEEKNAVISLMDSWQEFSFIRIQKEEVLICLYDRGNVFLYLSNLFIDYTGAFGAYSEQIDETWNVTIMYAPKG